MTAKRRYDLKRKGDPDRARKERARNKMRTTPKTGRCEHCNNYFFKADTKTTPDTVWHHLDYDGQQRNCVELCHRCHRAQHPRRMPHGGTR